MKPFLCLALLFLLTMVTNGAEERSGSIQTLYKQAFSGLETKTNMVIRSAEDWEKVKAQLLRKQVGGPELPVVDFSKQMVLLAAMGRKSKGGFSIEISDVDTKGSKVNVTVLSKTPPAGSMGLMALTAPVHAVAVSKTEADVTFLEKTIESSRDK